MKTEQQIVDEGNFIHDILASSTFNAIYQEYTSEALSAIVGSQPHETKKREFEYTKLQALSGFMAHLADLAASAHAIQNPPEQSYED